LWSETRVLVTGGAGFIGSNLAAKLLELGSKVVVADNFCRGSMENIKPFRKRIHLYKVDLRHMRNCLLATKDVNYVFHLAASVGGIHYIKKENVEGLTPSVLMNANMLEASRRRRVERFLFTSSACVYPEKKTVLNEFREQDAHPAQPATTYGWAKILGEIQCRSYYLDYGIKSSVPRIFNAYGENENLDPRWSHVIPSLIRKALLYPREGFRIFGDGKQERAFLYVQDCVDGLLRCMERIEDAEAINLGGEELTSIESLARRVIALSGKPIDLEFDPSGPQGTHRYCANTSMMKSKLAWSPRVSLEEGLARTYDWARRTLHVQQ